MPGAGRAGPAGSPRPLTAIPPGASTAFTLRLPREVESSFRHPAATASGRALECTGEQARQSGVPHEDAAVPRGALRPADVGPPWLELSLAPACSPFAPAGGGLLTGHLWSRILHPKWSDDLIIWRPHQ